MRKHTLAAALAAGLAMSMGATAIAADGERVLLSYAPGTQAEVERALEEQGAVIHHRFDAINTLSVTLPAFSTMNLLDRPEVRYVEVDARRYPMAETVPYGIDLIQARDVWDANRDGVVDDGAHTGEGMTVCVIDSGLSAGHEDFAQVNVIGGHPAGWNEDQCGHGTHVAGTIAAAANGRGVVGVSPGDVSLYILKVFGTAGSPSCGWTYASTLMDAANRCAAAGAKVINMSLGGGGSSAAEGAFFQSLLDSGVLSIAAAGNGGNTALSYPASYDAVVSVAAVDANKALAAFSQRNAQVELAAPGVGTLSTVGYRSSGFSVGGLDVAVQAIGESVQTEVSGALVDGGLCTTPVAGAEGKLVLCERGEVSFAIKGQNAEAGGASGVVIYNNVPGGFAGTFGEAGAVGIPGVSMGQAEGQALVAEALGQVAALSTRFTYPANGYDTMSGTSMATPHVAGAAAVLWSADPTLTARQIRNVLAASAQDLGAPGRDPSFGHGLVQLADAVAIVESGNIPGDPPPPPGPEVTPLSNGVPVTVSVAAGALGYWQIDVPADATDLRVAISPEAGATGDADLYLRFGALPELTTYDCRPYLIGNTEECVVELPQEGRYYVAVRAFPTDGPVANVSLVASFEAPDPIDLTPHGLVVTTSDRGRPTWTLTWESGDEQVEITRNGALVYTGPNTGSWSHFKPAGKPVPMTYVVCNTGTEQCSVPVTSR